MNTTDLINLYFERSSALQWYWTLYVVIIGGLLAFSGLRHRPSFVSTLLVAILYCAFAYKNMGAIVDTTHQRQAVIDLLQDHTADSTVAKLLPTMVNVPPDSVRRFHVTCDVLTVVTLLVFEIRRRRFKREDETRY